MYPLEQTLTSPSPELTGANVPANGLAPSRGISVDSWIEGQSLLRLSIDMTGQIVDPILPHSLLRGLQTPLGDPLQAQPIMQPDIWSSRPEPADVPSLWLLSDAHVFGGRSIGRNALGQLGRRGLLTSNGSLIPASYNVADGEREISVDLLERIDNSLWLKDVPSHRYLEGLHFFIGAASDHFGHMILEGVSRLWALDYLTNETLESVKFLVYEDSHRAHTLEILELAGVPADRIVHASAHDVVQRLIVPDTAMRSHRSITKMQSGTWEKMASNVGGSTPNRKIFLSRRKARDRRLSNEGEIESYFDSIGYELVTPEELSVSEQVRLAAESISLAGCVGSQMYLACFQQPGAHNIVIAPRNFFLKDDILITQSKGIELEVVLGSKIDFRMPKTLMHWSVDLGAVRAAVRILNPRLG